MVLRSHPGGRLGGPAEPHVVNQYWLSMVTSW